MIVLVAFAGAALLRLLGRHRAGGILALVGVLAGLVHLGALWIDLGRPPLRTLGETRWWYSVLVGGMGLWLARRFAAPSLAVASAAMAALFAAVNLAHPDAVDRTLMPALQSPLFVPHVVLYLLAYAALGLASLQAAWNLLRGSDDAELPHRLVELGFPLLTGGLLVGAVWAREAWGHYWAWDPKETWAFLTWSVYLVYLHVRPSARVRLLLLALGFLVLMLCWFGVHALPVGQESVHTYGRG